jgi:hypothetical protein
MIVAGEHAADDGILLLANGLVLVSADLSADVRPLEFLRDGRCGRERHEGCPDEHKTDHNHYLS